MVSGAGVPDPPKQPQCVARSAHSATVTWEGPVNNGATITDYRLEWQQKAEQDFQLVGDTGSFCENNLGNFDCSPYLPTSQDSC